jgi:hypothetical protein
MMDNDSDARDDLSEVSPVIIDPSPIKSDIF